MQAAGYSSYVPYPVRPEPYCAEERKPSPERLDSLAIVSRCHRGQKVCSFGGSFGTWYRVLTGVARRCTLQADGRRQITDLLLPGDCCGFSLEQEEHFCVEAIVDGTSVACYPRRRAEQLADADPSVARAIRDMAFAAISRSQRQIMILGRPSAVEKVGCFLLTMAERLSRRSGERMALPISRYDIAEYLAISAETVSRSLTELRHRGFISLAGTRQVQIVDRAALEDLVESAH